MAGAAEHPRIIESSVAVAAATGARLCSLIRNTSQLVLSRLVLRITRRYSSFRPRYIPNHEC